MVGGGCFSIFRRADDVTRTMSKGGGVLVNVQERGINPSFPPPTKAFPTPMGLPDPSRVPATEHIRMIYYVTS